MSLALPKTYKTVRWSADLDAGGVDTASDLESLEQDVLHILQETLGSNLADPDKGCGAQDYLSGTLGQLQQLPGLIDAQLGDVTRITSSQSTLLPQLPDGSWVVQVNIVVAGSVYELQFAIGPGGVTGPQ